MSLALLGSLGTPELILILMVAGLVVLMGVVPFWFICSKAGLSPWLSLIMLLPGGALILPILLAVMDWPSVRKPS